MDCEEDSFLNSLISSLYEGRNRTFKYHNNSDSLNIFAYSIVKKLSFYNLDTKTRLFIISLIKNHDYRFIGIYLYALKNNKPNIIKLLQDISNMSLNDSHKLKNRLFSEMLLCKPRAEILEKPPIKINIAKSIDEFFNSHAEGMKILEIDNKFSTSIIELVQSFGINFGNFINLHFDIPGLNAITRNNLIKKIYLPTANVIVCKKNNLLKAQKFETEQRNYKFIKNIFPQEVIVVKNGYEINIKFVFPFLLLKDGYNNRHYAFSEFIEGDSLDDLLLREKNPAKRNLYLSCFRFILDMLLDKGILWGDMSARNIILNQIDNKVFISLFDFEKTQIKDSKISLLERIQFARGQIFAEELCILCSLQEIIDYFSDYFNPNSWGAYSDKVLQSNAREEILDIKKRQGIEYHNISLAEYNELDKTIIMNRYMRIFTDSKKEIICAFLGFKIEHYLSILNKKQPRVYENKVTEIFLLVKQPNVLKSIVVMLSLIIDKLEYEFIYEEFYNIIQVDCFKVSKSKHQVADLLCHYINSTYNIISIQDS